MDWTEDMFFKTSDLEGIWGNNRMKNRETKKWKWVKKKDKSNM